MQSMLLDINQRHRLCLTDVIWRDWSALSPKVDVDAETGTLPRRLPIRRRLSRPFHVLQDRHWIRMMSLRNQFGKRGIPGGFTKIIGSSLAISACCSILRISGIDRDQCERRPTRCILTLQ